MSLHYIILQPHPADYTGRSFQSRVFVVKYMLHTNR